MALYLIKGYDKLYGGLHGMNNFDIVECRSDADAIDWALDLAQKVVESYAEISDSLEERVKEECEAVGIDYESNDPGVDEIRDEVYREDYEIEVGLLDESLLPDLVEEDFDNLYWEDSEEFENLYVLRWI